MKKIILSISLILAFNMSNAQSQRINSEKIDAYKKIYLTEKLNLDQKLYKIFHSYKSFLLSLEVSEYNHPLHNKISQNPHFLL